MWSSVTVITLFDVLIVGTCGYACWSHYKHRTLVAGGIVGLGSLLVTLGVVVIGLLYTADFLTMHLFPLFMPMADAIGFMTDLHNNYVWFVTLLGIGSIVAGFAITITNVSALIEQSRHRLLRFRDVAEVASDWVWEMDQELRFSYLSDRFFESIPIPADEIIGKTAAQFGAGTADNEAWRRHMDDLAKRRSFRNFEYAVSLPNGGIRHILANGKPIFDAAGTFKGYRGTGTDKTAEIEARKALEESETQFRNLIEGSIQGMFIHKDREILFANPTMADIFGYDDPADIVALGTVEALISSDEHQRLWGYLKARQSGEQAPEFFETRCVSKDGSKIWAEFRVKQVDWHGIAAMQCVVIDITDRKKAENELLEQNERFNTALENISGGLCMFDAEQRLVVCNERYASIFGLSPEQVKPGTTLREIVSLRIANGLYPDTDIDAFLKSCKDLVNDGKFVHRITELSDGRVLGVSFQPMSNGGWLSTQEDITEKTKIETLNLRLARIVETAINEVYVFDAETFKFLQVNASACKNLGYTMQELTELTPVDLKPDHTLETFEHIIAPLTSGEKGHVQFETIHRRKDGSLYDVGVTLQRIGSADRRVFAAIIEDITERKKTEETLRQQNEELRRRDSELKEQNRRFNTALDTMSEGLCMFDGEKRLIVCNRRYASMYNLSPAQIEPGTTLNDIFNLRIANGIYADTDLETYAKEWQEWVDGGAKTYKVKVLSDGRVIGITHQPMAGGGWLSSHADITEFRSIQEQLSHLANHDALTDLPNRMLLRERMDEELKRVQRGKGFSLLCLDLDGFKGVNDTLGHPAGDELLKAVGERLRGCVREIDTVARLGGDEFAIIQTSTDQPEDVAVLASRICALIAAPFTLGDHEVVVGTSIGVAVAPNDGTDPDELMKKADMALYQAKGDGRGRYRFFRPELEESVNDRQALGLDLRKALANGELALHYQPLVNLETNRVSGFEALLRWHHRQRGMVAPNDFIPVAEELGLINQIGEWVLGRACREAAAWPTEIKVAVNVSPVQFRGGQLVAAVANALAASGLEACRLELEITERVLLQEEKATLAVLHQLHGLGVRISLDNFGSGHTALSYLRSFPFDKIKIDASFIGELAPGEDDAGMIHAIVTMAGKLGAVTTAEGVETEEQLAIIRAEGCTEAQGYLFSPPCPPDALHRLIRQPHRRTESAA